MDPKSWFRLQVNWEELTSQDIFDSLTDYLYTEGILSKDEIERFKAGDTPKDRMEKLLLELKKKPQRKKVYSVLIDALRSPQLHSAFLADQISTTPAEPSSSIRWGEPQTTQEKVRQTLLRKFKYEAGEKTSLDDIAQALQDNRAFKDLDEVNPWDHKKIGEFVCQVYADVHRKKEQSRRKMKTLTVQFVTNLTKINVDSQEAGSPKVTREVNPAGDAPKVGTLSCLQLKDFLAPKLEAQGMSAQLLDELEANEVSGQVFLTLNAEDLRECFPSASFGSRKFLAMLIEELKEPVAAAMPPSMMSLRKFDTSVSASLCYIAGRCCDITSNVNDKSIKTVRLFDLACLETTKEECLRNMAALVVAFTSACLNQLRNGTVYFGINPCKSKDHHKGEIVGVSISPDEIQTTMEKYIERSFPQPQRERVKRMVREAKFVPVRHENDVQERLTGKPSCWVVEVDVNPTTKLLGDQKIITLLHLLPVPEKKGAAEGMFEFSQDGYPCLMSPEKRMHFENARPHILKQRKQEETARQAANPGDLRKKLLNLLTGGCDLMQVDIFPFLMVSPLSRNMDEEYLSKNMAFVKNVGAELILDFGVDDEDGLYHNVEKKQEESIRVLTTDNFDPNVEQTDLKNLKESLDAESGSFWMFCNGYKALEIDPCSRLEWKRKCKPGFLKALDYFIECFGSDRITLVICLFSESYELMLDACEEAILKLSEGWMVIAESEDVVQRWSQDMLQRNCVEKSDLVQRLVVGMTWPEVNATIHEATQGISPQTYLLPTARGVHVEIREKKLKDWADLEIVSAGDANVGNDPDARMRKAAVESFYRGEQVTWQNFWFGDQVLTRDIHGHLKIRVTSALSGISLEEDAFPMAVVSVLHQPGAGGTTSARQVLWDLRTQYRCVMVRTISNMTADQIDEVHRYKDQKPGPVLVLIDNEDEDKYIQLRGELEDRGRRFWRSTETEAPQMYCVVLLCVRRATLPKQVSTDEIVLRQELSQQELNWFKSTSEQLAKGYKLDKQANVNPRFLISFNILKENFDKNYIKKVVKEFVDDITDPRELELLKFVSFFNTYDLSFKPVRVSCLDIFIATKDFLRCQSSAVGNRRKILWEAQLSQAIKVLLNLSTNREAHRKPRTVVRVFNRNIAEEILLNVKSRQNDTDSSIMRQLLHSKVFQRDSWDAGHMRTMLNSICKRREVKEDMKRRQLFSPFILQVKASEGAEVAVNVLEFLFEENEDPFTAQVISRFYLKFLKNFRKAEFFARRAIELNPFNSYLWDTYGQAFKEELQEKFVNVGHTVRERDLSEVISLTRKCISAFQKEQQVSEQEEISNGEKNLAGYFGELHSIISILDALNNVPCFGGANGFHDFLIGRSSDVQVSGFLNHEEIRFLRDLASLSSMTVRRLDDQLLQMKGNMNHDVITITFQEPNRRSFLKARVTLDEYFGEPGHGVPQNMPEKDKCEYRFRQAMRLGGATLNQILSLRSNKKMDIVHKIYVLVRENMSKRYHTFDNIRTVLDCATLLLIDRKGPRDLSYDIILEWSRLLYTMESSQQNEHRYLEPYLYFTMYNFPTEARQGGNLCHFADLQQAIGSWFEAFRKKYPKSSQEDSRQKSSTLFFLGNGGPPHDIVHQHSIKEHMQHFSHQDKWHQPEVCRKLLLMSGTLSQKGDKIRTQLKYQGGNTFSLDITTGMPIRRKDWLQKSVYFFLGFSFSGPKAYGISIDEPGLD